MSNNKDKRRIELENEIERLQRKLIEIENDENEEDNVKFVQPLPPLPPSSPSSPEPPRHVRNIMFGKKLEDNELQKHNKELLEKERIKIDHELKKMREKLNQERTELHNKRRDFENYKKVLREKERELRRKEQELREKKPNSYTWDIDLDEDIEGMTSDLEIRLGEYTSSILSSVADSLKSSMGLAIKGAGYVGDELKSVGGEISKIGKEIGDKISQEVNVTIGPKIPKEKLEEFYEVGANIVSAIGDSNRLRILKELEKEPMYQKELSDITNLRGGTFKHHMDKLIEDNVRFVAQEVVRGRYLLTTRGREALKLAEIQFMRYLEDKERKRRVAIIDKDEEDSDDEYNVKIR